MKTKQKPKHRSFWQRAKRFITFSVVFVCMVVFVIVFYNTQALFSGRVGSVAAWSLTHTAGASLGALPWWVWAIVVGVVGYLWRQHKIIMSVVLTLCGGVLLAIIY